MMRIRYNSLAVALLLVSAAVPFVAGNAAAVTAVPNGAIVYPRYFNDCAVTGLAVTNAYPALIRTDETNLICAGGQNLHVWHLSSDLGATSAVYNNADAFRFGATLVLTNDGTDQVPVEAGLLIAPWWDQFANGFFHVKVQGEIAVFGGVLPFYSFTASHGINYVEGEPIGLEVVYNPHCNTAADPGTIEYIVRWRGQTYTSGPLAFGNCTVGEEIHGCYGIMDNARLGGHIQETMFAAPAPGSADTRNIASFFDVFFEVLANPCPVPTETQTLGSIKAIYR